MAASVRVQDSVLFIVLSGYASGQGVLRRPQYPPGPRAADGIVLRPGPDVQKDARQTFQVLVLPAVLRPHSGRRGVLPEVRMEKAIATPSFRSAPHRTC